MGSGRGISTYKVALSPREVAHLRAGLYLRPCLRHFLDCIEVRGGAAELEVDRPLADDYLAAFIARLAEFKDGGKRRSGERRLLEALIAKFTGSGWAQAPACDEPRFMRRR